jgi:prophage maintenance system killer protein
VRPRQRPAAIRTRPATAASRLWPRLRHRPTRAAYTAGIVGDHPFVDGNKRTGFLVGVLFLELNGYRFTAPEEEAAVAVEALAAGGIGADGYAAFLSANSQASD